MKITKMVTPKTDLGGGVTLCLSHEVDYANLLFGKQINLLSIGGKNLT